MSDAASFKVLQRKAEAICRAWWLELYDADADTGEERKHSRADRGHIARLRRIGTLSDGVCETIDITAALGVEPYWLLRNRLIGLWNAWPEERRPRVVDIESRIALVAAVLARVRKSGKADAAPTAARLGEKKDRSDEASRLMAEARFKHLIRADSDAELLDHGRRIVALLGHDAPVGHLGASLLMWGPAVVRQWAFDYYGASDAAPEDAGDTAGETDTATLAAQ